MVRLEPPLAAGVPVPAPVALVAPAAGVPVAEPLVEPVPAPIAEGVPVVEPAPDAGVPVPVEPELLPELPAPPQAASTIAASTIIVARTLYFFIK